MSNLINPILIKIDELRDIIQLHPCRESTKNKMLSLLNSIRSLYILDDEIVRLVPTVCFCDGFLTEKQEHFRSIIANKYMIRKQIFFGNMKK